jgi:putative ABC transport system permease protein
LCGDRPLASKEAVVLISLVKSGSNKPSNVVIRGVSPTGLGLRPQVKLVAGRMFKAGLSGIIVDALRAR